MNTEIDISFETQAPYENKNLYEEGRSKQLLFPF